MQTFLAYPLYSKSAQILDRQRLGKQRVECLQILECLYGGKPGWKNHPAVRMWRGFEKSLAVYGLFICKEWIKRGYKDTCFNKIKKYIPDYNFTGEKCIDYSGIIAKEYPSPKWLGDENFHRAHKSNLIKKNPSYYRPIFGIDIPDNLPYIWPINES